MSWGQKIFLQFLNLHSTHFTPLMNHHFVKSAYGDQECMPESQMG